jgi:hypothetical protein
VIKFGNAEWEEMKEEKKEEAKIVIKKETPKIEENKNQ